MCSFLQLKSNPQQPQLQMRSRFRLSLRTVQQCCTLPEYCTVPQAHFTSHGVVSQLTQLVASMARRQCRSGVAQLKNPERCSTRHHEYAELQKTLLGNNDVSAGICSSVFVPNSDLATHSNDLLCFPAESTGAGLGCPRHPRHRPIL